MLEKTEWQVFNILNCKLASFSAVGIFPVNFQQIGYSRRNFITQNEHDILGTA
jgi:hypothetical protein